MLWISTKVSRFILIAALVTTGFAQMHGGGNVGGRVTGSTATMSGLGVGMGNMAFCPTIAADGTAYVLRQTAQTGMMGIASSVKTELVAINPLNGKVNWALPIDGTMISGPALAKDGTILLTTSEPEMMTAVSKSTSPALIIVAPTSNSARVQARIPIDSDMLSLPVMTPDGQTIYVIGTDMPDTPMSQQGTAPANTYLYAFFPGTGGLKFKVQLR